MYKWNDKYACYLNHCFVYSIRHINWGATLTWKSFEVQVLAKGIGNENVARYQKVTVPLNFLWNYFLFFFPSDLTCKS